MGLVRKAAENYPANRDCFSCHHQTLPVLAIVAARAAGVEVDEDVSRGRPTFSHESFGERLDELKEGKISAAAR